jgi:hypothetical protein
MGKLRRALLFSAIAVGTLFAMGFGIGSARTAPDNVIVVIDAEQKLYFALPCAPDGMQDFVRITLGQARKLGFQAETNCWEKATFLQDDRSLSGLLLQLIGVLPPHRPRWNADGSWNW